LITVSPANPDDAGAIADLLAEMDRFYGAAGTEPQSERIRQVGEALFGSPPAGTVLLAWDGTALVGFASYSFLWPAVGLTRSLYLKELYVTEPYQRRGVGQQLMNELFALAAKHGCSRVEWTTDTDNPGAQAFYARLGIPVETTKLFYRRAQP
jgi:GNAT superfamily N-acetyltransferase